MATEGRNYRKKHCDSDEEYFNENEGSEKNGVKGGDSKDKAESDSRKANGSDAKGSEGDRSRHRDRSSDRSRDRSKDSKRKKRSRSRSSSRSRRRSRSRERDRKRDRSRSSDRHRRRSRSRSGRKRDRDRSRERSRDGHRRRRRSSSPRRSRSRDGDKNKGRGKKIYSSEGLFLGYESDMIKPKPEESKESEAEKKANAAALASAMSAPPGSSAASANQQGLSGGVINNPSLAQQQQLLGQSLQSANQLRTQMEAHKKASRIQVSNLPDGISDRKVREFMNGAMKSSGLAEEDCVTDVYVNSNSRFAFVQLRSPEEATSCIINLDGLLMNGQELKIARPQDFTFAANLAGIGMAGTGELSQTQLFLQQHQLEQIFQLQRLAAGDNGQLIAKKPKVSQEEGMKITMRARRVKFTNIPNDDEMHAGFMSFLNALFEASKLNIKNGPAIINAEILPDKTSAIVEFRTVKEALSATQNLIGIQYGDNHLKVSFAEGYKPLSDEETWKVMGTGYLGINIDMIRSSQSQMVKKKANSEPVESEATTVLVLEKVFSEKELNDDAECKDILEDTKLKCMEDFGEIDQAIVVRGTEAADLPACSHMKGKLLILFKDKKIAFKAAQGLHGVKFDGRPVIASFADEKTFEELSKRVTMKI